MRSWATWPLRLAWFVCWFAAEFVVGSVRVLRDNLTPGQSSTPGVARFETRCLSDVEVTLLAVCITLTPGTVTLGVQPTACDRRRVIFVHGLYDADAEALRDDLRRLENHLLGAWRREGVGS